MHENTNNANCITIPRFAASLPCISPRPHLHPLKPVTHLMYTFFLQVSTARLSDCGIASRNHVYMQVCGAWARSAQYGHCSPWSRPPERQGVLHEPRSQSPPLPRHATESLAHDGRLGNASVVPRCAGHLGKAPEHNCASLEDRQLGACRGLLSVQVYVDWIRYRKWPLLNRLSSGCVCL